MTNFLQALFTKYNFKNVQMLNLTFFSIIINFCFYTKFVVSDQRSNTNRCEMYREYNQKNFIKHEHSFRKIFWVHLRFRVLITELWKLRNSVGCWITSFLIRYKIVDSFKEK
ncbi:hypothetical protein HZS_4051 [Henneguya salminicola]|nr:hypothetical protein HZS_4051 [Henneguya salminicola]